MKSLYIKNFKNIKELTIEKLAPVNLIVGQNNVGKSTLLEAISIYLTHGNPDWLSNLLENRGESIRMYHRDDSQENVIEEHYLSFFPGREKNYSKEYKITIGENKENTIQIHQIHMVEETIKDDDGVERKRTKSLDIEDFGKENYNIVGSGIEIITNNVKFILSYRRPYISYNISYNISNICPFQYVHTIDFKSNLNAALFDKISLSPEENEIIEALHIIEPGINKINFLNIEEHRDERIPYVTLNNSDKRIRLTSMGDGINRILTIILSLLNCKNGILLLDEFETGLHYSVQTKLWKVIFTLAEKLNIQVFVTSHSQDCINSFVKENNEGKGIVIRLEKRHDEIVPVIYDDNEKLNFIVNNFIEIR
jgi:AAA15 family ATPase/GTPase